VKEGHAIS